MRRIKFVIPVLMCVLALTMFGASDVDAKSGITVGIGQTYQLTRKNATWSSKNKKIATVSKKGLVKGKKKGKTTITAKVGKKTYKYTVTVKTIKTKSIKIKTSSKKMEAGKTLKLKGVVKPTNSTQKITWSSGNKKVAAVSANGVVTGKDKGTVTITAKSGKKKAKVKIKVTKVAVTKVTVSGKSSVKAGSAVKLEAKVEPDNASLKTVTWTSSNKKIAKVSSNGKVTGVKAGKVTITATADGVKATYIVTVKTAISLNQTTMTKYVGRTGTLKATVKGCNGTVKWTSADKNVATVSSDGVVTAMKAGSTKITATVDGVSASCKVKVNNLPLHDQTRLIAHRGYNALYAENCMEAFSHAFEGGHDGAETDVQLTKDGVLVLIHDDTIDRTSDGTGNVADMTYEELKKYNFGAYKDQEASIVTLEEFLKAGKTAGKLMNVEIKVEATAGTVKKTCAMIKKLGCEDLVFFSSGKTGILTEIREYMPDAPLYLIAYNNANFDQAIRNILNNDFEGVVGHKAKLTDAKISELRSKGVAIGVWTVNDEDTFDHYKDQGVDFIITDTYFEH